ncbi:MAG: septal ring lytic transglycosylase RlpA family protein [Acidobacteria bacterium]|nr:septal ring lytic transglycosylase RlpA family protein [Acidobacteriota bacterium]
MRSVRRSFLLIVILALLSGACGGKKRIQPPRPSRVSPGGVQRGLASFYGHNDGYDGKTTASGERFDKNKLTAAHYDLPLGTRVRVQNRNNGRKVVVRINDRIPIETLRRGRIIDLSYKAAQVLEMVRAGVVPVILEILSTPRP